MTSGAESGETTAATESPVTEPTPIETTPIEAMNVHPFPVVLTGTVLFGLAFLGLLPFWSWLGDHGHRDWLWTALAGALLGLSALPLMKKHRGEGRID